MEAQILEELHSMNEKIDVGFSSVTHRLDGFNQRLEVMDERFFRLKDQVEDYTKLTVQNTIAISELREAICGRRNHYGRRRPARCGRPQES